MPTFFPWLEADMEACRHLSPCHVITKAAAIRLAACKWSSLVGVMSWIFADQIIPDAPNKDAKQSEVLGLDRLDANPQIQPLASVWSGH